MAQAILLHIQESQTKYLPRHYGEWLDAISQQTRRSVSYSPIPTAHTDWAATLSSFGVYPSDQYIERRSEQDSDTSFIRVMRWTAREVLQADAFVRSKLSRNPLTPRTRSQFEVVEQIVEGRTRNSGTPSDFDIEVCRSAGGIWLILARIAQLLISLSNGGAKAQLFALRPILPEFSHQLFELGVLGCVAKAANHAIDSAEWKTFSPISGAGGGTPVLTMQARETSWSAYYQSAPKSYRRPNSPYRQLTRSLDGRSLRPDIWIDCTKSDFRIEIVFECKYSLDPTYIATGVPQSFAYLTEYPPISSARRIHVVVGPEEVVNETTSFEEQFVVTNPAGAQKLVAEIVSSKSLDLASIILGLR